MSAQWLARDVAIHGRGIRSVTVTLFATGAVTMLYGEYRLALAFVHALRDQRVATVPSASMLAAFTIVWLGIGLWIAGLTLTIIAHLVHGA
jgi:hypothetical protein